MELNKKQNIKIKLGGMTCASCALKIENKLGSLSGVSSSIVNFANEEANVEYDSNISNYNDFNKAIRDLGYKATLSKIDILIKNPLPEEKFEDLVNKVKGIDGVYDVRGNFPASKLFIEFNEVEVGETKLYSIIKKLVHHSLNSV